jgi:hypothetical protein
LTLLELKNHHGVCHNNADDLQSFKEELISDFWEEEYKLHSDGQSLVR